MSIVWQHVQVFDGVETILRLRCIYCRTKIKQPCLNLARALTQHRNLKATQLMERLARVSIFVRKFLNEMFVSIA